MPPCSRWPELERGSEHYEAERISAIPAEPGLYFLRPGGPELDVAVRPGSGSKAGAQAAIASIERAVEAALAGDADAICTAPIHKSTLRSAGFKHPGHTELLAERSGTTDYAMMLEGGGLRVALATIHVPLASVPGLLDRSELVRLMKLLNRSLVDFDVDLKAGKARIAVAGLNPHAGEGGLLGDEEIRIIAPAIEEARAGGVDARGPFAADTIFHRARSGEFDAVLAMYHDQGLVAVKTLDFHGGVNTTLGLPFVRTSPDHGTGYDIAGTGAARPDSMIAALASAYRQAAARRDRQNPSDRQSPHHRVESARS